MQDAQTSNEDQIDYGSSEANEAVKQLQQLGAIVYPPGLKGEVDWGLLAGDQLFADLESQLRLYPLNELWDGDLC